MYEKANTLLSIAYSLEQQGRLGEALERYDEALAEPIPNAASALIWYNKGNIFSGLGQTAEAESAYVRSLRMPPPSWLLPHVLNNFSWMLMNASRWHEALACLEIVKDRYRDLPFIAVKLARVLYYLDRFKEASEAAGYALQLEPDNPAAWQLIRMAHSHEERMKQMLAESESQIQVDRNSVEGWRRKLSALLNLGQFPKVLKVADQALALNKKWSEVYVLRAEAMLAVGTPERAVAECDQALQIDPDNSLAKYIRTMSERVMSFHAKIQPIG